MQGGPAAGRARPGVGQKEKVDCLPSQGAKLDQRWWSPRENRAKCLTQPQSRSRRSICPASVTASQCIDRCSCTQSRRLSRSRIRCLGRGGHRAVRGGCVPCVSDWARRLPLMWRPHKEKHRYLGDGRVTRNGKRYKRQCVGGGWAFSPPLALRRVLSQPAFVSNRLAGFLDLECRWFWPKSWVMLSGGSPLNLRPVCLFLCGAGLVMCRHVPLTQIV